MSRVSIKSSQIVVFELLSLLAPRFLHAGSILGEAKFDGVAPKPSEIRVTKDQDYCGEHLPDETRLIGPGGALKNVVVFI